MKLTPRSMAWLSAAREVLSSVDPQSFPPIPHAPKPIADIFQPVRPKARYSMFSILSAKIVSLPVVYSNGIARARILLAKSLRIFVRAAASPQPSPLRGEGAVVALWSCQQYPRRESHGMCAFDTIALAVLPYERK